jgi:hypothetical protein
MSANAQRLWVTASSAYRAARVAYPASCRKSPTIPNPPNNKEKKDALQNGMHTVNARSGK